MPELSVFARITPKPEYKEQALNAVRAIVDKTRAEPGCQRFELNVDVEDQMSFYLVEHWDNDEALALHYEQDYTKEVFVSYQDWLSKPPMIIKMRRDK